MGESRQLHGSHRSSTREINTASEVDPYHIVLIPIVAVLKESIPICHQRIYFAQSAGHLSKPHTAACATRNMYEALLPKLLAGTSLHAQEMPSSKHIFRSTENMVLNAG